MAIFALIPRRAAGALIACAAMASPLAHSQINAPVVTAWGDTKQLKFDWDPVPNAAYYQLLFHAPGSTTTFFTLSPSKTAATNNISAHLFDWDRWSYGVTACNSQGSCSEGRPPVAIKTLMQDTIGYFKPSVTNQEANFGYRVALAEDGNTFAVLSREEPVGSSRAAPFYVFTKIAGRWRQQARSFPSTTTPRLHNLGIDPSSGSLAMSQDGNTLMVGMPFQTEKDGYGYNNSVSIYRRSNNSWALEYQIVNPGEVGPTPSENQYFARMDLAGTRIVARLDSRVQMLERGSAGWKVREIPQPIDFCMDTRLSGDGKTIAYFCGVSNEFPTRVFLAKYPDWVPVMAFDAAAPRQNYGSALAINYQGTMIAVGIHEFIDTGEYPVPTPFEVRVYRQRDGAWQQFGNTLRAGSWSDANGPSFGEQLEFSRNGTYLAVAYRLDAGQGTGVWSPPLVKAPGSTHTGAVYVYEFPTSGPQLRRVVKPNVEFASMDGMDLSLANDGKTLLIGQPEENSKSTGIDGNRNDSSLPRAGAAWLY